MLKYQLYINHKKKFAFLILQVGGFKYKNQGHKVDRLDSDIIGNSYFEDTFLKISLFIQKFIHIIYIIDNCTLHFLFVKNMIKISNCRENAM